MNKVLALGLAGVLVTYRRVAVQTRFALSSCRCIPTVCKKWRDLHASPALWESMLVPLPLRGQRAPTLQWVHRRIPGAKGMVLR